MPETESLPFVTVGEAAALIGISEQSVRRLAGRGVLRARRFGRDWLIDAGAARSYAERERRPGRPQLQRLDSESRAKLQELGGQMADAYEAGSRPFGELATLVLLLSAGQSRPVGEIEQRISDALGAVAPASVHGVLVQQAAELLRNHHGEAPFFHGVGPADVGWTEFLHDLNEMAGSARDDAVRRLIGALHDGGFDDLASMVRRSTR